MLITWLTARNSRLGQAESRPGWRERRYAPGSTGHTRWMPGHTGASRGHTEPSQGHTEPSRGHTETRHLYLSSNAGASTSRGCHASVGAPSATQRSRMRPASALCLVAATTNPWSKQVPGHER